MISNVTNRTDPSSVKSRVFVGNLNTVQMTKIELESIFSRYGAVIGISVHKGYAFVQYANEVSARAAVMAEDSKQYYNMILDVTIASEPKNRKRGRSNVNPGMPSCPGLSELALQAHALSSSLGNSANKHPMLSLRQLAGGGSGGGGAFDGIMGQPNLSHFAAAAGVLRGGSASGSQLSPSAGSGSNYHYSRSKSNRGGLHGPLSATSSSLSLSGAKRTRLEAGAPAMGYGGSDGSRSHHNLMPSYEQGGRSRQKTSQFMRSTASQRHHHQLDYDDLHYRAKSPRQLSRGPFRSSVPQQKLSGRETSPQQQRMADVSGDRLRRRRVPAAASSSGSATPPSHRVRKNAEKPENDEQRDKVEHGEEERSLPRKLSGDDDEPVVTARAVSDDILICGNCRLFFDHVDDLISHKMAGCSLGTGTCEVCRCRSTGEPSSLACAYCGAVFDRAWALVCHCQIHHGVTVYTLNSGSTVEGGQSGEELEEPPAGTFFEAAEDDGEGEFGEEQPEGLDAMATNDDTAPTDSRQTEEEEDELDGVELVPSPTVQEVSDTKAEEAEDLTKSNGTLEEEEDKLEPGHNGSGDGVAGEETEVVDGTTI